MRHTKINHSNLILSTNNQDNNTFLTLCQRAENVFFSYYISVELKMFSCKFSCPRKIIWASKDDSYVGEAENQK